MDTSDRAGAVTDRVPGGVEPTTKLLVKGGGKGGYLTEKFLVIGDFIPSNNLLTQEGLQLAEASFRDLPRQLYLGFYPGKFLCAPCDIFSTDPHCTSTSGFNLVEHQRKTQTVPIHFRFHIGRLTSQQKASTKQLGHGSAHPSRVDLPCDSWDDQSDPIGHGIYD